MLVLELVLGRALVDRARSFRTAWCDFGMRRSGLDGWRLGLGGLVIVFLGGCLCLKLLIVVSGSFVLH